MPQIADKRFRLPDPGIGQVSRSRRRLGSVRYLHRPDAVLDLGRFDKIIEKIGWVSESGGQFTVLFGKIEAVDSVGINQPVSGLDQ